MFEWLNTYPYTDFHELNLDWIIKAIKRLSKELTDFVNLNTIKYADPIQWNITSQYETNTVVLDSLTGTAYLSKQPVPSGVSITDTAYWQVIFTLDILNVNENITLRDDGLNINATFASDTGDWLLWNGILYKVTQPISVNTAYVVGFNIDRYTVELFIADYINALNNIIGDLNDLTTTDKDSVVDAINELVASVGDLTTLTTVNQDSIVDAVNELVTTIGDLNNLTTTDKDSVVDAINELVSTISTFSGLDIATPEMFGAVGDGVNDDTAAVEEAFTHPFVILSQTYRITDMIRIENNTNIEGSNGQILCDGDTDYWLFINGVNVRISGVFFEKIDANFTYYNRAIRFEQSADAHVSDCHFKNFGTAIHSANGESFSCENIFIEDVYGEQPQYGYGVDTSSKNNIISGIVGKNATPTSGRHLIYLNGDIMESATVSNVYCLNWMHHPIDISIHDQTPAKAMIKISDVIFDTVNVDPLGNNKEMCAINSSVNTTAHIQVDNVTYKNMNTGILFFRGTAITAAITNITAYLTAPIYVSQTVIKLRDLTNASIKNVKLFGRDLNMTYALELRDCTDAIVDEIYDVTSAALDYGLSVNGGSIYLGDYILTGTLYKIRQSNTPTINVIDRFSI